MQHKTCQQLYAYWNDIRGGRIAPRRFDIEPSRIAPILPETFMLERTDFETYRFRLAGTRLCEQFRTEFRGTDFLEGWGSEDRLELQRGLLRIAEQGGALQAELAAFPELFPRQARFELLILPLVHLRPTADRFIGAWCAIDPPSWLGAERLATRTLISCDVVWPDGRPNAVVERQEHQVPFRSHVRTGRLVRFDRRQFRVYDGGLVDRPPRLPGCSR
jgi:hypothetical protein